MLSIFATVTAAREFVILCFPKTFNLTFLIFSFLSKFVFLISMSKKDPFSLIVIFVALMSLFVFKP